MKKILASIAALVLSTSLAFSQATIQVPSGEVVGNSTAATRNARPESVTAILDRALGSTRGSILRRGAASWTAVVPSATVGLPWVSAGTGADPLYQALGVAGGGTGHTSYVVGDLLFASSTSALSRLADVATGNALISGGVGVAPLWGKIGISTHVSGLGTGVATALAINTGANAGSFVTYNGPLGTPSAATLTNATGLPIATGVSGLGTGIATALAVNTGSAGAPVLFNGALGTPSSGTLTNATGLPIATGVSGLGTGVATALGTNVGSAGAFVTFNGALGSPSSVGTLPAFTLGGTIAGGGNQINNVVIGTTTPLAGSFTTLTASTSVSSPIHTSSGKLTFQSNGSTFAGSIGTDQRWYIGGTDVAPPTSSLTPLTVSKNTSVVPRFQTQNPLLVLAAGDNEQTWSILQSFSNTSGHGAGIGMARAGGTAATPTSVQSGQQVGFNFMYSYCATGDCASPGYKAVTGFEAVATDNLTDATQGTRLNLYAAPTGGTIAIRMAITGGVGIGTTAQVGAGLLYTNASTFMIGSKTTYANGAAAAGGTLTNAPAAGNPTKWIPVDDNGTTRYIPAW